MSSQVVAVCLQSSAVAVALVSLLESEFEMTTDPRAADVVIADRYEPGAYSVALLVAPTAVACAEAVTLVERGDVVAVFTEWTCSLSRWLSMQRAATFDASARR